MTFNDRGQIVGIDGWRAFLWKDGRRIDAGEYAELAYTVAINNRGQIVHSAILWQNGRTYNLLELLKEQDRTLIKKRLPRLTAVDINDRGQIFCEGGVLLTPE